MLRKLLIIFMLLVIPSISLAADNMCLECHLDLEDETGPSHMITRDIHFQKGLGCVGCHGGDASLDDMDEVRDSKGYKGVPDPFDIPNFCASCHSNASYMREHNPSLPTDQLDKYKTSVHGQRLFNNKDTKVANCVSCHSVHEIGDARMPHSSTHPLNLPATCGSCHADEALMADYDIGTSQLADFTESVHGIALLQNRDLGAPACNDCHGNHGAAPPGVNSLAAVCGTCHALEADLYNTSPHQEAFAENDYPMCETCHGNHKIIKPFDAMVGNKEPALCIECHDADDGTKGIETAKGISESITKLRAAHDEAAVILDEAIAKGMMTTDEEFRLKEVTQNLIQTRTLVHAFNIDSVQPKAEEGLKKAEEVKTNSAALIDEYYFRRKGLGIATLFITILAIGLYMKIRRLD